jgi:hypothetical protein
MPGIFSRWNRALIYGLILKIWRSEITSFKRCFSFPKLFVTIYGTSDICPDDPDKNECLIVWSLHVQAYRRGRNIRKYLLKECQWRTVPVLVLDAENPWSLEIWRSKKLRRKRPERRTSMSDCSSRQFKLLFELPFSAGRIVSTITICTLFIFESTDVSEFQNLEFVARVSLVTLHGSDPRCCYLPHQGQLSLIW